MKTFPSFPITPLQFTLYLLLVLPFSALAQTEKKLTFVIESVPSNTPEKDTLYIVGNFNEWNPSDRRYTFKKESDNHYYITFGTKLDSFEYKITRGGWKRVEGNSSGEIRPNRTYHFSQGNTVKIRIESWEDLGVAHLNTFQFVVHQLPESTPFDASLFITGNFNGWNPGDIRYKLVKNEQGLFSIDVKTELQTIEYKFTRGNWASVEGRNDGRSMRNRKTSIPEGQSKILVNIAIRTWEDIDGEKFHFYHFLLLLGAFQGFLLSIAIATIQDNNRKANYLLITLLLLTSFALLARLSEYYRNIFHLQPKLLLTSDLIFFLYAPVFLLYIQRLLFQEKIQRRFQGLLFIPFLIHLLVYMPFFVTEKQEFIDKVVDGYYRPYFQFFGGAALVFNFFVWRKCYQLIKKYQQESIQKYSFDQNVSYLQTVSNVQALCLLIWLATYLFSFVSLMTDKEEEWFRITEIGVETIWIIFSATTYVLGYYAMNQPEVLKIRKTDMLFSNNVSSSPLPLVTVVIDETANTSPSGTIHEKNTPYPQEESTVGKHYHSVMDKEEIAAYKEKLIKLMEKEEPYLNQRLTIGEVAERLKTNVHTLSRVINEGFEKNFYDFVNHYRIQKFIQLANSDKFKHLTFLALAMEVGFSSKSAFNRAFKKTMGVTPSEYFQDSRRNED